MQSNVSAGFNSDLLDNNLKNSKITNESFPALHSYPVSNSLSIKQKQSDFHFYILHRSLPVFAGSAKGPHQSGESGFEDFLTRVRHLDADVPLIVLGLGLGDHVNQILSKIRANLIILEKNPGLVKASLSRFDWSDFLRSEDLIISDPLHFIFNNFVSIRHEMIFHPFIGKCYFDVAQLLKASQPVNNVDLLMDGKLLIDDWYHTLLDHNRNPYIYPPNFYDISKIRSDFQHYNIQKIWSINRLSGLENLAEELKLSYSIYEIDPDLSDIPEVKQKHNFTTLFSYRKPQAKWYRDKGWNATYLPLASNHKRFSVSADDNYRCRISFVGDSILENANKVKKQVIEHCNEDQKKLIESFWQDQAANPERSVLPDYRDKLAFHFSSLVISTDFGQINLLKTLSEWSGACHRVHLVRCASEFGIDVWGDQAWQVIAGKTKGLNYRGRASHLKEVPIIYASSYINLDITRIYQPDVATLRLFDVFAAGSLAITNVEDENGELYPNPRLITFSNSTGMMHRINEILEWSKTTYRNYIHAMKKQTLENHTLDHRLQRILECEKQVTDT